VSGAGEGRGTGQRYGGETSDQQQRPPRCYVPDGRRFTVSGRRITWLDWQFYFNIRTTTGPVFHDIRFRAQRIIYELALQVMYTHSITPYVVHILLS